MTESIEISNRVVSLRHGAASVNSQAGLACKSSAADSACNRRGRNDPGETKKHMLQEWIESEIGTVEPGIKIKRGRKWALSGERRP